jgi:hypothetical protein
MIRIALVPPIAACVFALAGAALAADRGSASNVRDCVDPPSANTSWTPYDDHTILVRSGSRSYQVTTSRCPRLADPLPKIITKVLGGSTICSPHDVRLYVGDSAESIPTPCFIQSITPLTEDQAKAIEQQRH